MSYPYLSDVLKDLSGIHFPLPIPTFGLCVLVAMLVATRVFRIELQRMRQIGALTAMESASRNAAPHPSEDSAALDEFVSTFSLVVLIACIVGARAFHILEHLPEFQSDPWPMAFSRSSFSILGGLIFGAVAGAWMARRCGLPMPLMLDAAAPAMMIGYGIGRIGCQVSGDDDWGTAANMALKPDWLPTWRWAQAYPGNIHGVVIAAPGVYPTPIYETAMALCLFGLLWAIRQHPFRKGWLFAIYLLLAGAERLLIEQIRINPVMEVLGIEITQAELISVVFIVSGLVGAALLSRQPTASIDVGQRTPVAIR